VKSPFESWLLNELISVEMISQHFTYQNESQMCLEVQLVEVVGTATQVK
jgi:hypothetical protein